MLNLAAGNNEIIRRLTPEFLDQVHQQEIAMDIRHHRTRQEPKPKAKYRENSGEIVKISVGLTKGLIMTHKGKGRYPANRKEKPFYNPEAEKFCVLLADEIAINTGDVIAGNLCIR